MTDFTCTWVRDHLPDRAHDALDIAESARLEQHLAVCDDCRAEAALVNALAIPVRMPAEVEAALLQSVASGAPAAASGWPGFRHYAVAASFAFAVITGSILWQRSAAGPSGLELDVETVLAQPAGADPLLHEAGLQSLSEDELRALLEELES